MAFRKSALAAAVALVALCAFARAADKPAEACTPMALTAPTKLHAKKVSATAVEFAWEAPKAPKNACLETYNFYILKKGEEAALQGKAPVRKSIKCGGQVKNAGTFTATGLAPNTEYTFAVNVANAKGASPDAKLVVRTKAA